MRKTNPIRFLYLFFVSVLISNTRLLNFAKDHKNRMNANNGLGIYTLKIAAMTTSIALYEGSIVGIETSLGQQATGTMHKDEAIQEFADFAHAEEPHIAWLTAADEAVYLQFYTHGLTEFNKISKEKAPILMARFRDAAHNNVPIVGAPFEAVCQGYLDRFNTALDTQETKMGAVGTGRVNIKTKRTDLIQHLIDDTGFVASNNKADMLAAESFFNFPMLYRVRTINHIHLPATGDISTPAYTVGNAGLILLDEGTEVTATNNSNAELWVYGSATIDGVAGALKMIVPPHSTRTMMAPLIDAVDHHFINGFVNNLTEPGLWNIDIHDAV